ncbi:MAG: hypothetical protein IPM56_07425 [Ignavibacteriales bacterium]|nr:MAG: hypothetical protein IPM56_07425 [Ignavibacteriales bacterium]
MNKLFFLSLLVGLSSGFLNSQTYNLQTIPTNKTLAGLVFEKPFYGMELEPSILSGSYKLNFSVPVSDKINVIAILPFSAISYEFGSGIYAAEYSESGLGNVFLGIQTKPVMPDVANSFITAGIYLPTAEKKIAFTGLMSNYYDLQAYIPDAIGIYGNYAYHRIEEHGPSYGIEFGPNLILGVGDYNSETDFFVHYGGVAGYSFNRVGINFELLGVLLLTSDPENFGDRFVHMVNLGAHWKGEVFIPKIFYKIYLREELKKSVDGILGIGISVLFD